MKDKLIEIKLTKATLFIHEHDLYNYLPRHVIEERLRRGEAIKKRRQYEARMKYPQVEERLYPK